MKSAVDVVYRDLDSSAALNNIITKKLEKLNRYTDQIVHSRVVLDAPHQHKHKGKQYRASIELDIKGHPIAITQDDESIHIAVREVFSSAERKVKQLAARQRSR
jgi:ribosomal subunit interface protein